MTEAKFNERKISILESIKDGTETISELSDEAGISESTVRSLLRKYENQGLVEKEKGDVIPYGGRKPNRYSITDRGENKLNYLK